MPSNYIFRLWLNSWGCILLLIVALLMLSFLDLARLSILWHSHEVVDYIEVIIDHVPAWHDILAIKQSRVVDVRRWVSLLKSSPACCLRVTSDKSALWLLSVPLLIRITEITTELRLVLCSQILLSLPMPRAWISTLGSFSSLNLQLLLLLLVILLLILYSFLRLFALKWLLLMVAIGLLRVWPDLD